MSHITISVTSSVDLVLCPLNFKQVTVYFDTADEQVYQSIGCGSNVNTSTPPGSTIYSYCAGTTRNYFVWDGSTVNKDYDYNNITCAPPACSLSLTSVVVTHETGYQNGDGQVVITVSGASGTANYTVVGGSVNTTQTAGTFTGLVAGNYDYVVVDAAECALNGEFTINAASAIANYNIIYRLRYHSEGGHVTTIDISDRDSVVASPKILRAPSNPFAMTWDGSGQDKFQTIKGSSARLSVTSDVNFQFKSILSNDEKRYKLSKYKYNNLDWVGFLVADQHFEPYLTTPYDVELTAVDGLGLLKGYDFLSENNARYTGNKTIMQILVIVLSKLDLQLSIYTSVEIFDTLMTESNSTDPLVQTTINTDVFYIDDKVYNCYEVLEYILKPFAARIYQCGGGWHIVSIASIGNTYIKRKYSYLGVYQSNSTFNPVANLTGANTTTDRLVFLDESARLEIIAPYKVKEIDYDYGVNTNLIVDGNFDKWANGTTALKWISIGNISRFSINDDISTFGAKIKKEQDTDTLDYYVLSQTFPYTLEAGTKLSFRARYKIESVITTEPGSKDVDSISDGVAYGVGKTIYQVVAHGYLVDDYIQINDWEDEFGQNNVFKVKDVINADSFTIQSPFGATLPDGVTVSPPDTDIDTAISISIDDEWYLDRRGEWTHQYALINIPVNDVNKFISFTILSKSVPATGDISVRLFNFVDNKLQSTDTEGNTSIVWSNAQALFYPQGLAPIKSTNYEATQTGKYTSITPGINTILGDMPSGSNSKNIYQGGLLFGSSATGAWHRRGIVENQKLLKLLLQVILNNYGDPIYKLSGTLAGGKGNEINMNSLIKDKHLNGKSFIVDKLTVNDESHEFDVILIELNNG